MGYMMIWRAARENINKQTLKVMKCFVIFKTNVSAKTG